MFCKKWVSMDIALASPVAHVTRACRVKREGRSGSGLGQMFETACYINSSRVQVLQEAVP